MIYQPTKKLAIANGEPFFKEDFASDQSLISYLKTTINLLNDGQIISFEIDNQKPNIKTYSQIWHFATTILFGLRKSEVKPQEFILIITNQCSDFISAIWTCWMGGFIPIPVQFSPSQPQQFQLKMKEIYKILDKPIILTTKKITSLLEKDNLLPSNLTLIQLENIDTKSTDQQFYEHNPEDLAALFFSSGTTGKPKLVSFTYQAILNRLIENQPQNPHHINSFYWLPLDHASTSLRIVNPNAQQKVILPTEAFLKNPLRWLDIIEMYSITQTNMTNFGMALIHEQMKSVGDRAWNLQSVTNMGIGAEMIVPQTYQNFLKSLEPFGLKPDVIFTGYGLTECGTVVGGKASLIDAPNNQGQFIQLGKPCRGYSIRIIDDQGYIVNEGDIGNVQVMGPSSTKKYYDNSHDTQALFSQDGWINTGDLGFIQNGYLTITGRSKDIIIINAKNYSCELIEQVVNSINGINNTATVACGIQQKNSTTDELVIFFHHHSITNAEIISNPNLKLIQLINQIRLTIITQLNITPTYIIPILPTAIPRTTFGKIQRRKLIEKIHAGEFNSLINTIETITKNELKTNFVPPTTDIEKSIHNIWLEVFQLPSIGIKDNFFTLGGQSLLAAQIISRLCEQFKIDLPLNILFEKSTIRELVLYIEDKLNTPNSAHKTTAIIKINSHGTKTPLYFINSSIVANKLSQFLDKDQPFHSLNIFGLTSRISTPFTQLTIDDFAHYLIQDLLEFQPTGAYKLIGFCQDGGLTLEIAQQLKNQGKSVDLVCLVDVLFQEKSLQLFEHLQLFSQFGWLYLITKFKVHLKNFTTRLNHNIINQFNLDNNYDQTRNITNIIDLDRQLYNAYLQAATKYKPSTYMGKLISIQSQEWSYKNQSNLQTIANNKLESYKIKSLHHTLFDEPYIRLFAQQLQPLLRIKQESQFS